MFQQSHFWAYNRGKKKVSLEDMHPYIHSNTKHSSQDMEPA